MRDATFALWGLYTLGFDWEANDFFYFVADVAGAEGAELQIMYGIDGQQVPEERVLDHLSGYEGARPVRIGNAAAAQDQHDVWGSVVGSIDLHLRSRDRLDDGLWAIVITQVERALARWREPDHGIWEVRGINALTQVIRAERGQRPRRTALEREPETPAVPARNVERRPAG